MSYWEERQKQLDKQLEKDEEKLKKKLSDIYEKEAAKLEKKIAAFYQQYGTDNIIEYRQLLLKLDPTEIKLLMEEVDAFAEKYPQYAHLVPIRENIYKLNRLEGLHTSIYMQQLEIGAINNEELQKHLEKNAQIYVNQTAEMLGFGKNFYSINSSIVQDLVNASWANGINFSQSIWKNTEKLANYLNQDVSHAFARGDAYARIVRNMKDRFDKVSRNDMYRLIYTEGTFVKNEASIKPLEEDFDEYRILPVSDSKVCRVCKGMANQTFSIQERMPGINFPPFHPWCCCSYKIVVEDWDKWIDDYVEKHSNKQNAEKVMRNIGGYKSISNNKEENQYYRDINYDRNNFDSITRGKTINLFRINSYKDNEIYVSKEAFDTIKRKQVHNINIRISESLKKVDAEKNWKKPKVYIVSESEMANGAQASYNFVHNVVFVTPNLGLQKNDLKNVQTIYAASNNDLSTPLHEMFHWKYAMEYKEKHGVINDVTDYINKLNKKHKRILDKLGVDIYNVGDISEYAKSTYLLGKYSESYTEYRVKSKLERR